MCALCERQPLVGRARPGHRHVVRARERHGEGFLDRHAVVGDQDALGHRTTELSSSSVRVNSRPILRHDAQRLDTATNGSAEIRLVVNADDFGMSPSISRGILRAHRDGSSPARPLLGNCTDLERCARVAGGGARSGRGRAPGAGRGRPDRRPEERPLADRADRLTGLTGTALAPAPSMGAARSSSRPGASGGSTPPTSNASSTRR